jgi:hypothetical protein
MNLSLYQPAYYNSTLDIYVHRFVESDIARTIWFYIFYQIGLIYLYNAPLQIGGYRGYSFNQICILIDKTVSEKKQCDDVVVKYANSVGQIVLTIFILIFAFNFGMMITLFLIKKLLELVVATVVVFVKWIWATVVFFIKGIWATVVFFIEGIWATAVFFVKWIWKNGSDNKMPLSLEPPGEEIKSPREEIKSPREESPREESPRSGIANKKQKKKHRGRK